MPTITNKCIGFSRTYEEEKRHYPCNKAVITVMPFHDSTNNYYLRLTCIFGHQNTIPIYINGNVIHIENTPSLEIYNLCKPKKWQNGVVVPDQDGKIKVEDQQGVINLH